MPKDCDIPLFFANIDTPGEQQKFSLALIIWFFYHVPRNATANVLYDIGCVLEQSIQLVRISWLFGWQQILFILLQYDILPVSIQQRIRFCTTAMHAYGHQWACQLVYNPRFICGMGLSDGEGVERLWAMIRKLISLVRTSSVSESMLNVAVCHLTSRCQLRCFEAYSERDLCQIYKLTGTCKDEDEAVHDWPGQRRY